MIVRPIRQGCSLIALSRNEFSAENVINLKGHEELTDAAAAEPKRVDFCVCFLRSIMDMQTSGPTDRLSYKEARAHLED